MQRSELEPQPRRPKRIFFEHHRFPDEARRSGLVERAFEDGLLDKLPKPQQDVLKQRYPSVKEDVAPSTLEEIGRSMRVTRQRVRQIEDEALENIRRLRKGEPLIKRIRRRPDITPEETVELYRQGMSQGEIATLKGCSKHIIGRRLRSIGFHSKIGRRKK